MSTNLWIHGGLTVIAAATSLFLWTREKPSKNAFVGESVIFSIRSSEIEQIQYESSQKKLSLSSSKDAEGTYFVGATSKIGSFSDADAGTSTKDTSSEFISVGPTEKLIGFLTPLKSVRDVGPIENNRLSEFGLAEPEGIVTIRTSGKSYELVLGGPTPGGNDRYAKLTSNSNIYVVKGDIFQDLNSAETRLVEKDLHSWKDPKDAGVTSAKIIASGKTRNVIRSGAEAKRFWADASAPDQNDETLGNWFKKFDSLKPSEFQKELPAQQETVLRIEYQSGSAAAGFVELHKVPSDAAKPSYFITSERLRYHAKVTATTAEQVEQDLSSVVK